MELPRSFLRRVLHVVYRPYVLWRIARPSRVRVSGQSLLTAPMVFHPIYFFSTRILIAHLKALDLAGKRFLDMGTGTGSVGIFAASRGAVVTCCDINPHAVALARQNATRNGAQLEVVESDLFASIPGRNFDVIGFNVPFYPKTPTTPLEAAFFAGPNFETVRAFAAGCAGGALAPDGTVVVVFSEDSGPELIASIFAQAGLVATGETVTSRLFERFHLVSFRRGP